MQAMMVEPPHLLITDWHMLPTDGLTLVRSMRRRRMGQVAANDDGSVYLSGIQPGAKMTTNWNGITQCEITLPTHIPQHGTQNLLLPCRPIAAGENPETENRS